MNADERGRSHKMYLQSDHGRTESKGEYYYQILLPLHQGLTRILRSSFFLNGSFEDISVVPEFGQMIPPRIISTKSNRWFRRPIVCSVQK